MVRFLIGWELGASPDLLLDIADIAAGLRARNHDVYLAAGDPVTLSTLLPRGSRWSVLPAPVPPLRPDLVMKPPREGGFADKLHAQGFGSPAVLASLAASWLTLVDAIAPEIVVSIGAPALAVAMRGRLPLLVAGSCESLPPVELGTWPRLHANIAPAQTDERLVEYANLVAQAIGSRPIRIPTDILRGDSTLVYGLPQIDPYAALRTTPSIGALLELPAVAVPAGRPAMVGVLDVYFPGIETVILALTDFGQTPVHLHIRGITAPMHNYLSQTPGISLHARVDEALAHASSASFILHHGASRIASYGIALGVPQSLLPYTTEQNAVADMLQRFNAGMRLNAGTDPTPLADALGRLFRNLDQVQNAQHLSRQLALQRSTRAIDELIDTAERLVAAAESGSRSDGSVSASV